MSFAGGRSGIPIPDGRDSEKAPTYLRCTIAQD